MNNTGQLIDWHTDDGVNINMIANHKRNQFYDAVLAGSVGNRDCVEVGFGTGILTLLALKHGARRVTAYENDPVRYAFGQQLIDELGIGARVCLHNQIYNEQSDQLVFHEVLGNNLWDESAWGFVKQNSNIVPSIYSSEFWTVEVTDSEWAQLMDQRRATHEQQRFFTWYRNIRDSSWPDCADSQDFANLPAAIQQECADNFGWDQHNQLLKYQFDPGVDLPARYIELISQSINQSELDRQHSTIHPAVWPSQDARSMYQSLLPRAQRVVRWRLDAQLHQYSIEYNDHATIHDWPNQLINIEIDKKHFSTKKLGFLRHTLAHDRHRIYLSMSSWAPAWQGLALFEPCDHNICLTQNLDNGQIRYSC